MSTAVLSSDFAGFNDSCLGARVARTEKKWIRCKEGTEIYSLGRTKLTELAREAGALVKIDGTLLIDTKTFDLFLETFRIKGESF